MTDDPPAPAPSTSSRWPPSWPASTPQTLRVYERKGLLDPSRTEGGSRRFSEAGPRPAPPDPGPDQRRAQPGGGPPGAGARGRGGPAPDASWTPPGPTPARRWPSPTASTAGSWCHCPSRRCRPGRPGVAPARNGRIRDDHQPRPLDAQDPGGVLRGRRAGPSRPQRRGHPRPPAGRRARPGRRHRRTHPHPGGRRAGRGRATGSPPTSPDCPRPSAGRSRASTAACATPSRRPTRCAPTWATSTCRSSTCCWRWPTASASTATSCWRRCATSGAATGSPPRTPRRPSRPSSGTAGTSPTLARQGKIDPVIGRDEEIRRVIQVLSRRTKNNPVLIGEPGVGKTAIVEGLAQPHRRGRRARGPEGQAGHRPGHGLDGGRGQVPRRVRGAPEGGAEGDRRRRGRGHHLHRRAPHHRRGRRRRGGHGRRQHDQADAGPRRAAA